MGKLYGATQDKISKMAPELISKLYQLSTSAPFDTFMVEGDRTTDRQLFLWQQGRDANGNIIDKSKVVIRKARSITT